MIHPSTGILALVLPFLAACGSDGLSHLPPCRNSAIFKDDVVVVRLREVAGRSWFNPDIRCHYRRVGTTSESIAYLGQTMGIWDDKISLFAADVPGTTHGETEYYFTYVNSNGDRSRVPSKGWFSCGPK